MGYTFYNPYVTATISTIGGMLFGFDISSVSSFIVQPQYLEYFGHPDAVAQGGITASMAGGSFIGSILSGPISDKLGRKPTIQIASLIWILGCIIQCSTGGHKPAGNVAQLIVGRIVAGLSIGLASSQVPVYIAELSPKRIRGRLVGIFQWSITWGIMIMFYIGFGCSYIEGSASFRLGWGLQMIPALFLLIGVFFLPESPRWLAYNDKWHEAIYIISHVHGKGSMDNPEVLIEILEIQEVVRIDKESDSIQFKDLFRKDSINRTFVGIWAQIWQQFSGVNCAIYFIAYIFAMAGYKGDINLISCSIQYVLNVFMTIPGLFLVDRIGRRPLLLLGSAFMMIFLLISGIVLAIWAEPVSSVDGNSNIRLLVPSNKKPISKLVIAFAYLFVSTFSMTWGPSIWIYCSEIFPLKQRARANGLCAASNWLANFALAMFFPPAFTNVTWKVYIIFAVFNLLAFFHVFLLFPETRGKSLEEIEQIWASNIVAWRSSSFVPRQPSPTEYKEFEKGVDHSLTEHDETESPLVGVT